MVYFVVHMTKLFLAAFVMLLFVHNAEAEEEPNVLCESLSLLAKKIMSARQSGVEMSVLIKKLDENVSKNAGDEEYKSIVAVEKEYIARAYEYPLVYQRDIKKQVGGGVRKSNLFDVLQDKKIIL